MKLINSQYQRRITMSHHTLKLIKLALLFSIAIALFAMQWCGCSTTTLIHPTSNEEMNAKLKGLDAIVQLKDGRRWGVKEVNVSNDSVSFLNRDTDSKCKITIQQVSKITTISNDHVLGALEGLGIGFIGVGLPIWALLGFSTESVGTSSGMPGPFAVVRVLAAAGGGIGLIIGAVSGFTYYDEFQLEEGTVSKSDSLKSPSR